MVRAEKVTVPRHTTVEVCPVANPDVEKQLTASVAASYELSRGVIAFLSDRSSEQKTQWLKRSVEAGRVIFQPWALEILFVLAVMGRTRFTDMQRLLTISSRTLSDKLQMLRDEGLIERDVFDEQPVRIEYHLTREGRDAAALATPLFAHLNHRAMVPK